MNQTRLHQTTPLTPRRVPIARWSTFLVYSCLVLLGCLSMGMSHCGPTWTEPLPVKTPQGKVSEQLKWFRLAFVRLAEMERSRRDGGDRVRRFVRQYSGLARTVYLDNQRRLKKRREAGEPFTQLDRLYIVMNAFIRKALPRRRRT